MDFFHGDLKYDNVMVRVNRDNSVSVKNIDFDFSGFVTNDEVMMSKQPLRNIDYIYSPRTETEVTYSKNLLFFYDVYRFFISLVLDNRLTDNIYHDITVDNGNITVNLGDIYNYFLGDFRNFAISRLGRPISQVITIYYDDVIELLSEIFGTDQNWNRTICNTQLVIDVFRIVAVYN